MKDSQIDGRSLRFQHRRPELLAAATEYVLANGVTELSLRPLASALGVTHATLLRHFSSKDELIVAVLNKIRADLINELNVETEFGTIRSTGESLRVVWQRLCEPSEQRQFLLLFELVDYHSRKPDGDRDLIASIVTGWLDAIAEALGRDGWPTEDASALATLVLAQVRGLQLDLLVSGDRARADRALEFSLRLLQRPEG